MKGKPQQHGSVAPTPSPHGWPGKGALLCRFEHACLIVASLEPTEQAVGSDDLTPDRARHDQRLYEGSSSRPPSDSTARSAWPATRLPGCCRSPSANPRRTPAEQNSRRHRREDIEEGREHAASPPTQPRPIAQPSADMRSVGIPSPRRLTSWAVACKPKARLGARHK